MKTYIKTIKLNIIYIMSNLDKYSSELSLFPKIKLSYELIHYNKVSSNYIYLIIPKGIKCFVWFTNTQNKDVCFMIYLNKNKEIIDIKTKITSFSRNLTYGNGTILYGTYFVNDSKSIFCIEDIFYYKGERIMSRYNDKLLLIGEILDEEITSYSYVKNCLIFGLPILNDNYDNIFKETNNVPYEIYCIQKRCNNLCSNIFYKTIKDKPKETNNTEVKKNNKPNYNKHINVNVNDKIFLVRAEIDPDIYSLCCLCNKEFVYYDIAYIPDFKTSTMMNSHFRNIKENFNLDSLEESDDEDDFEDDDLMKHLKKNLELKMLCRFNSSMKKWIPINIVDNEFIVSSLNELPKI